MSETSIHMSVAAFLRHAWPDDLPWWHVPNGEQRDKRAAGKLKGMGVLAGVPDLAFILPNGQAAFVELKARAGELSDVQIEFRDRVLSLKCGYAVARSVDDVERILAGWLGKFGRTLKASTVRRAA